ncbi:MAG: cytochrome-c peroxidase [Nitrospirae bacterium]|nr:cytochrome-c peroxidase [Nitrospirota bacterium]
MRRSSLLFLCGVLVFLSGQTFAGNLEPIKPSPEPIDNPQTYEKTELGKKLFFDRRLSGDGTMSCATCHIPDQAFADGQDIGMSYPTTKNWRNTSTLINIGLQKFLFYDGRGKSLEEQALFPIMSAFEMNRNLDFVEEVIRGVPEYVADFKKVFGAEPDKKKIAMALASFQRSLISKNSPLDRYLKGDKKALSKDAVKGLITFTGKGKCADCHYGATLSDDKFYALNVPENPDFKDDAGIAATRRFVAKISGFEDYRTLNEDPGRYLVTKDKKDWRAFRTPALREVSKTAPYMHNGVFKTLDEVIDFFDRGGGAGNDALKPLNLSAEEKKCLKTFLIEALAGEDLVIKHPQIP